MVTRTTADHVGEEAGNMDAVGSEPTTSAAAAADWANLMPDLLRLIGGKLTNISDYIAFRSVCPSWRSAVGPEDHTYSFLPWQICLSHTDAAVCFLNVTDGRVFLLDLPQEAQGNWIYGSSYGWLVTIGPPAMQPPGGAAVSLVNPITQAQIHLPSLPEQVILSYSTNFVLCSHPVSPRPRQPLVAAWNDYSVILAIWSQGDNNWTLLKVPGIIHDIVYFNEALYYIHDDGRLGVVDVAASTVRQLVEPRPPENATNDPINFYMDEFAGDLLLFLQYYEVSDDQLTKLLVYLTYKLDISGKRGWKWVAIDSSSLTVGMNLEPTGMPDLSDQLQEQEFYKVPSDQVRGVVDGITTRKYHHCLIWGHRTVLVPSLH